MYSPPPSITKPFENICKIVWILVDEQVPILVKKLPVLPSFHYFREKGPRFSAKGFLGRHKDLAADV